MTNIISSLFQKSNSDVSTGQFVVSYYTYWAIPIF
jgi:hypothetical protein